MRYFDNNLSLNTLYSAFNGELVGFKSIKDGSAVFCTCHAPRKSIAIYCVPFIINGGGELTKIDGETAKKAHEIIKGVLTAYINSTSRVDEVIEEFYQNYYETFRDYADKVPHTTCNFCGKPLLKKHESEVVTKDGRKRVNICSSCFNHLSVCNICGQSFFSDDGEVTRDGRIICPICKKREFILPYHRYYPEVKFFGTVDKNNPQPYLGVELEVDEGGENNSEAKKIMNIISANEMFAYCIYDGSIERGFELITQPATLTYHNSIKHIYKKMFDTLIKDGYTSHDSTTCGLHIHFNRNFYADDEELYITRLLYIIDKFWDDVVRISRRNQRRMERYTRKIDMAANDYIRRTNKSGDHDYHYYAVNLINQNTIEFRMFRGTLKIETFMATLQFVNNCIIAAKTKSAEEIQHMEFEDLITGRTLTSYWKKRKGLSDTEE